MRRLTIWIAAAAGCWSAATTQAAPPTRSATALTYRVGFHVFDKWNYPLDDGSKKPSETSAEKAPDEEPAKPLPTAVWFPAARTRKSPSHEYCKGVTGLAVRGAIALPGEKGRPLIVFSHDYGGSAISAVYLMEYLAGRGYVVAAPDHNDAESALRITGAGESDPKTVLRRKSYIVRKGADVLPVEGQPVPRRTALTRETYAYRMLEIKTVIDKMIAESKAPDSPLANMVDAEKIGIIAHGIGGFAAMAMMGMSPDHTDKRIKAAVLYSPTVVMWQPEEFYELVTPVMLMFGQKEEDLRKVLPAPSAVVYEYLLGPKWSVELRLGHAMTVCNTETIRAAGMPSQTRTVYAQHKMIGQYAMAMLDLHVRGQAPAAERLSEAQAKKDTTWIKGLKVETTRQPRPEPVEDTPEGAAGGRQ